LAQKYFGIVFITIGDYRFFMNIVYENI